MNTPDSEHKPVHLFTVFDIPVKIKPPVWPYPLMLWGGMILLSSIIKPARALLLRPFVALLYIPTALFADLGHAIAHSFSARLAGTPMKEIVIDSMPRTHYEDDDVPPYIQEQRDKGLAPGVPPEAHIIRALGGPAFSGLNLALSLIWRGFTAPESIAREFAEISIACHFFIFGAFLVPLPSVDAGAIVKWSLVKFGFLPYEADKLLRLGNLGLSAALALTGLGLMARGQFRVSLAALILSIVTLGAALDKIK